MEAAWVAKVADALTKFANISSDTTLAAFGGGGPFVVCKVAEAAGISRVLIPGLAAVFSAFGLGFSDRSEEHTSELQSLMRISYAVFCLKKQKKLLITLTTIQT